MHRVDRGNSSGILDNYSEQELAATTRSEVHLAHWQLKSLEVSGGFLSDLRLSFPPGLICIIGPRGSGKSTLAEALKLAVSGIPLNASKDRLGFIKANLGSRAHPR